MLHISRCCIYQDVAYIKMLHISRCCIYHDVAYIMMLHISWCCIYHDVVYIMMLLISWCCIYHEIADINLQSGVCAYSFINKSGTVMLRMFLVKWAPPECLVPHVKWLSTLRLMHYIYHKIKVHFVDVKKNPTVLLKLISFMVVRGRAIGLN